MGRLMLVLAKSVIYAVAAMRPRHVGALELLPA